MQRLSVGSPGGKPRLLDGGGAAEADEKAGKAAAARAAPDKSIHLIPVLTLLCFLILFLLSHDPASAASSSLPTATTRSLEATAAETTGGVHRRLKQEPRLPRGRGRRMGMAPAVTSARRGGR
uniref:Uncharacterized protein n=1 Tax=Leersia perrieri TaxID=77586 RepID=A0A0D9XMV2_9ORYZ